MTDDTRIAAASSFIGSLTLGRVVLTLALGAGGVLLYGLFDTRALWAAVAWQSNTLLGAVAGGMLFVSIGAALAAMQRRLDEQSAALYNQMRDQIVDMQRAIAADHSETKALAGEVAGLVASERQCKARVKALERQLMDGLRSIGAKDRRQHEYDDDEPGK